MRVLVSLGFTWVCLVMVSTVAAEDWPMWRYSASRSGISPQNLPKDLHLHWTRQLAEPKPAWPASQSKLQFDRTTQPVVSGQQLFVGSTVNDSITAYSTRTGEETWRFFTEGPVRFAPLAHRENVYAVSDDGHLYCLNAETGKLQWKVNGGPAKRPLIGNDRLISTWPARGGVVLADGVLYFTASIWPSMGIFIHAVDAETGRIFWTNSETGSRYIVHPHGASSFGSISPQGYLAVSGDYLIVPGGRSQPAVFHRKTGKMLHFDFGGKSTGGFSVMAGGGCYWVGGSLFRLKDNERFANVNVDLMNDETCIAVDRNLLKLQSLAGEIKTTKFTDRKGRKQTVSTYVPKTKQEIPAASGVSGKIFCQAGDRIYLANQKTITAVNLSEAIANKTAKAEWSVAMEKPVAAMIAADDRLFVITEENQLYCFGAEKRDPIHHLLTRDLPNRPQDQWVAQAQTLSDVSTSKSGYALALGIGSGRLIEELIKQTNLHIVVVDSNAEKRDKFCLQMDRLGFYGTRVSVVEGNPTSASLPPYFANLIICEETSVVQQLANPKMLAHIFQSLRPFGGVLAFSTSAESHQQIEKGIEENPNNFAGGKLSRQNSLTLLRREGALPKSAQWTHQYGDATNTLVSKDHLVKAPLGVLWFGGPSNDKVLPRHGHGPSPQVAGGRLIIEGPDMLRAVDVYTGRVHWEKELIGVGDYYNVTAHFSGAGEVGSNYVTLPDSVYVIHGQELLELDAATGTTAYAYQLPKNASKDSSAWGFLAVAGNQLVATSSPVKIAGGSSSKSTTGPVIPKGYQAVIKPHAEWHYLAGSDPKPDWATKDFSTKTWKQGPAGFGYGDGDDRTQLSKMLGRFNRVYIRKEISSTELKKFRDAQLAINFDDAFIAYLNGKEIARVNVGKGSGPQADKLDSHEAKGYESFLIKDFEKLIQPGQNVLAIEGHNVNLTSSDFSLDPYLIGKPVSKSSEIVKTDPSSAADTKRLAELLQPADKASSSRRLVVFDRKTRKQLWSRDAIYSFRHNGIVVTEDRVFCIDSLSQSQYQQLKRRGINVAGEARLLCLDSKTGREIWSTTKNVFGTFLNYSAEHDVLLQAGSAYRDRASDEAGTGMIAYRGKTGAVIWEDLSLSYNGPCLIWKDKIITNGSSGFQLGLLDGQKNGWKFSRMYGCNTVLGSEHLLTFRSGAAGFCDLTGNSGTGNLGGFRSSCTSNLIAADGVLNAPDYTRTCSCAYQNQTSVAWIHMPDAESWTFSSLSGADHLERIGWNLGAPGDRRSNEGTLWFEYPHHGGPSPKLTASHEPQNVSWFREHASVVSSDTTPWVTASGGEGLRKLTLTVPKTLAEKSAWTVKLYFSEPQNIQAGQRVFSINLQQDTVAENVDVIKESGSPNTTLVKEFLQVKPSRTLTVTLTPSKEATLQPVLSGVEIVPSIEN